MYKLLFIETGEYVIRNNSGKLCLLSDPNWHLTLPNYSIATYKHKETIHRVFEKGNQVVEVNGDRIILNLENKPLFEILEFEEKKEDRLYKYGSFWP